MSNDMMIDYALIMGKILEGGITPDIEDLILTRIDVPFFEPRVFGLKSTTRLLVVEMPSKEIYLTHAENLYSHNHKNWLLLM